ncbi:aminotransferase class I/II-fold pyridoxal phosphate-dependent enzyme [Paenibacillus silvae]|uniref:Aminotransferase n=1 Tax=Paenibacillus silvae TaxID=1325358 RepID=A0A2W6P0Y9_9BACL|nr:MULTISPECIES: aminotransferase class I/II-fold pyridoxal phosphate-dependent enzyme [Paenibacillus]MCK6074470.1 aminotransferase class I/II-fold pyridoxal phosphate-dependent enzyme [Paenibacillus silvae]MCK6148052.1 aminotransferase class I/II-fold pyridoxal phosphate-dependent enzyme [Paenibacillus silvae]MCK6266352.1 aminotransferase class I/II-fold pyridoxal phosphate-dependent enzyme [Paenibacillus silvae]PZT53390.1 pyridoxal phosphate-dependent aminotransferase [Paenibacillus silvae]G
MIVNEQTTGNNKTKTMSSYLAPLVKQIPPSGIRKFFDLVGDNKDIITLGVGEPDFVTPWHMREACVYSLERGMTSYTSNAGMPKLREALSQYLETQFDTKYDPKDEIIVTVGGSEAIDLALRALIVPGDEILIPEPSYVAYSPIASIGGGIPVGVETYAKDQFKVTAEALEASITPKSKVVILCYPSNPTGAIMTYEDWLPIAEVIKKHDLIVIADEIYAELTYNQKHVSFASIPDMKDRTILVSGFSKAFAMTGWRIGYMCGHPELIAAMLKIHQYTVMCAPAMGQVAALEALTNGLGEKDRMVESYNQRRRLIVQGFRDIGLDCHEPQGAFYAFPSIQKTGLSSDLFAERLLTENKVAAVPGNVFGPQGEGFLRCSYATSVSQLNEALERIGNFVYKVQKEG